MAASTPRKINLQQWRERCPLGLLSWWSPSTSSSSYAPLPPSPLLFFNHHPTPCPSLASSCFSPNLYFPSLSLKYSPIKSFPCSLFQATFILVLKQIYLSNKYLGWGCHTVSPVRSFTSIEKAFDIMATYDWYVENCGNNLFNITEKILTFLFHRPSESQLKWLFTSLTCIYLWRKTFHVDGTICQDGKPF